MCSLSFKINVGPERRCLLKGQVAQNFELETVDKIFCSLQSVLAYVHKLFRIPIDIQLICLNLNPARSHLWFKYVYRIPLIKPQNKFCSHSAVSEDHDKCYGGTLSVCGVGKLWIRVHFAVLNPYWECGCRSGSRSMEIYQNLHINLISCRTLAATLLFNCPVAVKFPFEHTCCRVRCIFNG